MQLPSKMNYTDAVKALGGAIKADWKHIKLHSSTTYMSNYKPLAAKELSDFIAHTARGNHVYYEILTDITFMELESMKVVYTCNLL